MTSPGSRGAARRVFVNAANVTGSGASVVVANLLPELYAAAPDVEFITLVPPALSAAAGAANARILTHPTRRGAANDAARLIDLHLTLPRLIARSGADVCLTLGDVGPADLPCAHVVFLHNPLYVYGPEELAGHHDWSAAKRRYLLWQFRRSAAGARTVIVQTPVMRARLAQRFGLSDARIEVISQPVPGHAAGAARRPVDSASGNGGGRTRLLFLAAYYPHKNHAILPAVVRELRARGMADSVQIFTTLGGQAPPSLQHELAACSDVVTDLGRLTPAAVADALASATALFLPTLVESYGLIYVEAMAWGLPILTSDRDFARWMCGDAARYFDPQDPAAIADAIAALPEFMRSADVAARGAARLRELPQDWSDVGRRFIDVVLAPARAAVENPVS